MKWSWKIGQWRGIAVYVHATFLILVGLLTMENVGELIAIHAALKSLRPVGVDS